MIPPSMMIVIEEPEAPPGSVYLIHRQPCRCRRVMCQDGAGNLLSVPECDPRIDRCGMRHAKITGLEEENMP